MAKRNRRSREEIELEKKGEEILEAAKKFDFEDNYFFVSTFHRYQTQLKILSQLKAEIDNGETLIKKEYVKGRENLCINPCITEYNKTVTAANQTALTLVKLLETAKENSDSREDDETDPLAKIFCGE